MNADDVYSDYSHWHDRTGPYETLKELEYTHICDGCHEIVDSVDTDTGLCDSCTYEDRMNKFYNTHQMSGVQSYEHILPRP